MLASIFVKIDGMPGKSPIQRKRFTRLPRSRAIETVVVRNMTRAQNPPAVAARRVIGADAVRTGEWAFIPSSAERAPEGNATLHFENRRIELTYASSVLGDFLTAIGRIQADYHRLSSKAHASPSVHGVEWTGRSVHV